MKKIALTLGLLAGATAAYSQGTLNWSDYQTGTYSITVWSTPTSPSVNNLGNSAIDTPAGNAVYTGVPTGPGFEAGLYVGATPAAVTTAILSGLPVATSAMQAGGGWDYSGSETATVPFAPGANVYVAIGAWSTTTGNPTSYATALAAGDNVGFSVTSTSTLEVGGTPSVGTPIIPSTLTGSGITDFTVGPVPEPSTIALGVMGASAFLMRLRRK